MDELRHHIPGLPSVGDACKIALHPGDGDGVALGQPAQKLGGAAGLLPHVDRIAGGGGVGIARDGIVRLRRGIATCRSGARRGEIACQDEAALPLIHDDAVAAHLAAYGHRRPGGHLQPHHCGGRRRLTQVGRAGRDHLTGICLRKRGRQKDEHGRKERNEQLCRDGYTPHKHYLHGFIESASQNGMGAPRRA